MGPRLLLLAFLLGTIVACFSKPPSRVESAWGTAQLDNTERMIANPEGSAPGTDPGAESDGVSAEYSLGRLRDAQTGGDKPALQPTVISVGAQSP